MVAGSFAHYSNVSLSSIARLLESRPGRRPNADPLGGLEFRWSTSTSRAGGAAISPTWRVR